MCAARGVVEATSVAASDLNSHRKKTDSVAIFGKHIIKFIFAKMEFHPRRVNKFTQQIAATTR